MGHHARPPPPTPHACGRLLGRLRDACRPRPRGRGRFGPRAMGGGRRRVGGHVHDDAARRAGTLDRDDQRRALVALQLALHELFALGGPAGISLVPHSHGRGFGESLGMLVAHLTATLITGWWLARGEAALWALLHSARHRLGAMFRLLRPPRVAVALPRAVPSPVRPSRCVTAPPSLRQPARSSTARRLTSVTAVTAVTAVCRRQRSRSPRAPAYGHRRRTAWRRSGLPDPPRPACPPETTVSRSAGRPDDPACRDRASPKIPRFRSPKWRTPMSLSHACRRLVAVTAGVTALTLGLALPALAHVTDQPRHRRAGRLHEGRLPGPERA